MQNERKENAIALRKEGKTYHEIRQIIPVAKSTLSDWLGSVGLSKPQKQKITQLRKDAGLRGAQARKDKRLKEVKDLNSKGIEEIGRLSRRELWLIGTVLHWAEGSKQKETNPSTGVIFTNSDPKMLLVFLKWLRHLGVPENKMVFEMYVHDNRKSEISTFKKWWESELSLQSGRISRVYLKKEKVRTNRKNITDLYHGLIRIKVRGSTSLNRQINGWIEGVVASI
jgi:hypothetical protein